MKLVRRHQITDRAERLDGIGKQRVHAIGEDTHRLPSASRTTGMHVGYWKTISTVGAYGKGAVRQEDNSSTSMSIYLYGLYQRWTPRGPNHRRDRQYNRGDCDADADQGRRRGSYPGLQDHVAADVQLDGRFHLLGMGEGSLALGVGQSFNHF